MKYKLNEPFKVTGFFTKQRESCIGTKSVACKMVLFIEQNFPVLRKRIIMQTLKLILFIHTLVSLKKIIDKPTFFPKIYVYQ